MSPSELTNTIEQFIVYVHRNEAHFTYIYVYHTNVSLADIYKDPPPNVISPIFFAIFISLWGSTHDSANCWSAHRSSAARDSFKRVHDLCKAWWRRPGAPPPQTKILATPVGGANYPHSGNKVNTLKTL